MSRRADGTCKCDRCGIDVGNAGVLECAVVSDIATDADGNLVPRVLHFCRVPNDGAPEGCAEHLLVPSVLTAYNDAQSQGG